MIILPRLARTLHHPALAVMLGFVLVAVALYGLVSGNIPKLWSAIILAVGVLNVLRAIPRSRQREAWRYLGSLTSGRCLLVSQPLTARMISSVTARDLRGAACAPGPPG